MHKSTFTFLIFISTSLLAVPNLFQKSEEEFRQKIKKVTFENGLTLLMMKRELSPTLALYIKFKVGAVDETPETGGTAHLLEHMLFKGTANVGTSDFSKEGIIQKQIEVTGNRLDEKKKKKRDLEERGASIPQELEEAIAKHGKILKNLIEWQDPYILKNEDSYIYEQNGEVGFNAYTSQDVTNYQIQLPKNRLEIWAKIESDRLRSPVLREYYTERDVIIEERRMRTDDSGSGALRERFFAVALESHPYRKPVIGYAKALPFLRIDETYQFFKNHYTPDNMVISIVGSLDFDETEAVIRSYFSDLKPGKKRRTLKVEEKQFLGEKRVTVIHPSSPQMLMGWLKPPAPHRDNAAFDVLSNVLTHGTSSRLHKKLVLDKKLSLSVASANGYPGERYSNLFTMFFKQQAGKRPDEIEKEVWEELENIKKNGVSPEELQKVKNQMIADFFRTMDDNATLADLLSYYELLYENWLEIFRQYDTIQEITSADLQRIVGQYLTKEKVTVGVLEDSRKKESK